MVENACQTEEVGLEEVVTADLERAVAAADAAATKALDLTAENSALASRVERGEQQVRIWTYENFAPGRTCECDLVVVARLLIFF